MGSFYEKKKNVIIIFSLLITVVCIIFLKIQYKDPDFYYTQEYLIRDNIQGQVDIKYFYDKNIDFAIGANKEGQAVFKNPSKAFKILKKDYKQGGVSIK